MLAQGALACVDSSPVRDKPAELSERVAKLLDDVRKDGKNGSGPVPCAVGAVPFDVARGVRLVVPERVLLAGPLPRRRTGEPSERPVGSVRLVETIPDATTYRKGVRESLARMESGRLSKVVLSRCLRVVSDAAVDIGRLVRRTAYANADGYTFAVALESATLVGASPELLVSRRRRRVVAHPLAGSRPRGRDAGEDARYAAELLASPKDRREHALVVEEVVRTLRPLCRYLTVPAEPSLLATPTLWHLATRIEGELDDGSVTSLALALHLHPTPAVCGSPRERARDVIRELEPYDRGFYTGTVGWCDADGDGEWVVAIRCAEIAGRHIRMFAGAGIVTGSREEEEWRETEVKLRTMLQAFGLEGGV